MERVTGLSRARRAGAAVMLCLLTTAVSVAAPLSFSALYSSTSAGGGEGMMNRSMSGTLFVGNGKIRTEGLDEGHVMARIIDPAQHTIYMLVPDQGFYEDDSHGGMPALPPDAPAFSAYDRGNPCAVMAGATCTKQGPATVGSRTCDIWQFNSGAGNWTGCIDRKTGLMLKKQLGNRTFELHDVRFGPVDPKLFEIPSDLKLGGFVKTRLGPGAGSPTGTASGGGRPEAAALLLTGAGSASVGVGAAATDAPASAAKN